MRLRVLVVDGEQRRAADMVAVLTAAGYEVSAVVETQSDLYAKVREIRPDVIIIDMDSPDRDMLEHLRGISRDDPRPIVMFCDDDADATIRAASNPSCRRPWRGSANFKRCGWNSPRRRARWPNASCWSAPRASS